MRISVLCNENLKISNPCNEQISHELHNFISKLLLTQNTNVRPHWPIDSLTLLVLGWKCHNCSWLNKSHPNSDYGQLRLLTKQETACYWKYLKALLNLPENWKMCHYVLKYSPTKIVTWRFGDLGLISRPCQDALKCGRLEIILIYRDCLILKEASSKTNHFR